MDIGLLEPGPDALIDGLRRTRNGFIRIIVEHGDPVDIRDEVLLRLLFHALVRRQHIVIELVAAIVLVQKEGEILFVHQDVLRQSQLVPSVFWSACH